MRLVLLPFQETAATKLLGHLDTAKFGYQRTGERYAVGLTATTGAGKTDMPELNRQTMNAPGRAATWPRPSYTTPAAGRGPPPGT
jgi:hypothetical protein